MLTLDLFTYRRLGSQPSGSITLDVATVVLSPGQSLVVGRATGEAPSGGASQHVEVTPAMLEGFDSETLPAEALRIEVFEGDHGPRAFVRFETSRPEAWRLFCGAVVTGSGRWLSLYGGDVLHLRARHRVERRGAEPPRGDGWISLLGMRVTSELPTRPHDDSPATRPPAEESELRSVVDGLRREFYPTADAVDWTKLGLALALHLHAPASAHKQSTLFPEAFTAAFGSLSGWERYVNPRELWDALDKAWNRAVSPDWRDMLPLSQEVEEPIGGGRDACRLIAARARTLGVVTGRDVAIAGALVPEPGEKRS